MSDVKWIKITTDIFDPDSKLFAIESLSDGHLIELVWFKLLVLTGKLNHNGFIINSAKIPYTDEMLSQAFRIDLGVIKRAIDIFETYGMIEVVENTYMISNWLEHQSGDRLDEIKEQNRKRQEKHRNKQKLLAEKDSNVTDNVTNNVNCSISISYSNSISNIINYLNNKCNKNYRSNTKNTIKHIKARLEEGYTEEDFYSVIDYKASQWLNDSKMSDYLRPDTLFGTKFESYLQSAPKKKEIVVEEPKVEAPIDYGWED